MNTQEIIQQLKPRIEHAIVEEIQFLNETSIEVKKESLKEVLSLLKQTPEPGYEVLMDLTGVDYIEPKVQTKIVYWLHNPTTYQRVRIFLYARRDESIPSVVDLWEGADWYERELFDLFGIKFEGHPDLKRILMPDEWEGHPLRRDYPLTEESVQFKHGVKPKVPSDIINVKKATRNISQLGSNGKKTRS
jgi:NADH-quinone oxidoreductase subunit C